MAKPTAPDFACEAQLVLGQIRKLKVVGNRSDRLLAYRALGALALKWTTKQAKRDPEQLDDLARAIEWKSDDLSRLRKLATAYSVNELRAAMKTAPHAELKHLVYLAGVEDNSIRKSLTAALGKHCWSATRLLREIQEKLGRRRRGGRPISPRTAVAAVHELRGRIAADRQLLGKCRSAIRRYARRGGSELDAVRKLEVEAGLLHADLRRVLANS